MNCLKKILVCVSAICLISCGNDESMVGTWAQPVPGLEGMKQGVTLEEGGRLPPSTWRHFVTKRGNRKGLCLSFPERAGETVKHSSFPTR